MVNIFNSWHKNLSSERPNINFTFDMEISQEIEKIIIFAGFNLNRYTLTLWIDSKIENMKIEIKPTDRPTLKSLKWSQKDANRNNLLESPNKLIIRLSSKNALLPCEISNFDFKRLINKWWYNGNVAFLSPRQLWYCSTQEVSCT